MQITNGDSLTFSKHIALFFPLRERTAHRIKGGAGHFRQVLAGQLQIDQHTLIVFLPDWCQADEGMCQALLDALGGRLSETLEKEF
jgi:hypothetical protein